MTEDIYEKLMISSIFEMLIGRCIIILADIFLQSSNLPDVFYIIVVSFGILLVILGFVVILVIMIENC